MINRLINKFRQKKNKIKIKKFLPGSLFVIEKVFLSTLQIVIAFKVVSPIFRLHFISNTIVFFCIISFASLFIPFYLSVDICNVTLSWRQMEKICLEKNRTLTLKTFSANCFQRVFHCFSLYSFYLGVVFCDVSLFRRAYGKDVFTKISSAYIKDFQCERFLQVFYCFFIIFFLISVDICDVNLILARIRKICVH